jgi:hypothetical protein
MYKYVAKRSIILRGAIVYIQWRIASCFHFRRLLDASWLIDHHLPIGQGRGLVSLCLLDGVVAFSRRFNALRSLRHVVLLISLFAGYWQTFSLYYETYPHGFDNLDRPYPVICT